MTDLNLAQKKILAERPHTATSVAWLKMLGRDCEWSVRWRVAANPTTPPEVLTELTRDKYVEVRLKAAENHRTPVAALRSLVQDENWFVAEEAAKNLSRLGRKSRKVKPYSKVQLDRLVMAAARQVQARKRCETWQCGGGCCNGEDGELEDALKSFLSPRRNQ